LIGLASGESIQLSAGVALRRSDGASVEVVSHRQDHNQFQQLLAYAPMNTISGPSERGQPWLPRPGGPTRQEVSRLQHVARNGQLDWKSAVIAVDGRPTIFRVTRFRTSWVAVGRGPHVDLTLEGLDLTHRDGQVLVGSVAAMPVELTFGYLPATPRRRAASPANYRPPGTTKVPRPPRRHRRYTPALPLRSVLFQPARRQCFLTTRSACPGFHIVISMLPSPTSTADAPITSAA
jgi:hypothetical protein